MRNIQVVVPDELLVALNQTDEEFASSMKTDYAVRLFQEARLTLGQAAALSGKPYAIFMSYLYEKGVPIINYSPDELYGELESLSDLKPS
jgi:predicted HTH domain antitoxin